MLYDIEYGIEIFAIKYYYIGDFRKKSNSEIEEVMKEYVSTSEEKNFKIVDSFIQ